MIKPQVTIEPITIDGEPRLKISIDCKDDRVILYVADDTLAEVGEAIARFRAEQWGAVG